MIWAGSYDFIREYQADLRRQAAFAQIANQVSEARAARRRAAWNRLLAGLLGSGGR
jgi:hypothetical protein